MKSVTDTTFVASLSTMLLGIVAENSFLRYLASPEGVRFITSMAGIIAIITGLMAVAHRLYKLFKWATVCKCKSACQGKRGCRL